MAESLLRPFLESAARVSRPPHLAPRPPHLAPPPRVKGPDRSALAPRPLALDACPYALNHRLCWSRTLSRVASSYNIDYGKLAKYYIRTGTYGLEDDTYGRTYEPAGPGRGVWGPPRNRRWRATHELRIQREPWRLYQFTYRPPTDTAGTILNCPKCDIDSGIFTSFQISGTEV